MPENRCTQWVPFKFKYAIGSILQIKLHSNKITLFDKNKTTVVCLQSGDDAEQGISIVMYLFSLEGRLFYPLHLTPMNPSL